MFRADGGLTTLMDVHFHRHFRAGRGSHGKGKQMTGRCGGDVVVRIPAGTMVFDAQSGEQLADICEPGRDWVAARGGRGGLGNMRFATSTHQAPREHTEGTKGERRRLRLELKLLADVGLVGLPNAGKSTLIRAVSNANPKVAAYPFTTKVPSLGLVNLGEGRSFVMADIPGLIEGAHEGAGMGIQFLRHIERTRIILHLIDPSDPSHPDAASSYRAIRSELCSYSEALALRPEIVVMTKLDIPAVRDGLARAKAALKRAGAKNVIAVSAAAHEGLKELLREVGRALAACPG